MTDPINEIPSSLSLIESRMTELGFIRASANFVLHSSGEIAINMHCTTLEGRRLGDLGIKIILGSSVNEVLYGAYEFLDSLPDQQTQDRQRSLRRMIDAMNDALLAGAEPGRVRDMVLTNLVPNNN